VLFVELHVEMNEMKPLLLLPVLLVGILSACDRGNPTPTAPSLPVPPIVARAVIMAVPNPAFVNEETTFEASLSSSSAITESTLDFGDDSVISFSPGQQVILKHIYTGAGTFIVTLNAKNTVGEKFSGSVAVVVRYRILPVPVLPIIGVQDKIPG
jgi:hypothetical protein